MKLREEEPAPSYSTTEADFNFNAPRKRIKWNLSSFWSGKICDSSMSSEADDITGLKEVRCSFRTVRMVKEEGLSVLVLVVLD